MNLEELRLKVRHLAGSASDEADQDFPGSSVDANRDIDWAINEAYPEEVNRVRRFIRRYAFMRAHPITWPASGLKLSIPAGLRGADLYRFRDDTGMATDEPGPWLGFDGRAENPDGLYRYDQNTWGWYPAPSSDRSLTVFYLAAARKLENPGDVPDLLPETDHDLLVWSAAIILTEKVGDQVHVGWLGRQLALRNILAKGIAQGSPMVPPPHLT